ncbi:carcinoembryonic antigen-related cell adhesion molecule 7-like [Anneissia japonica]|uniref:carcinoembryonic antigen-related cell adhesion molecule 7-like n=1 Tax=Anneissia japonica TaxID=1529436 RepID=UPI00142563B1|nr:carcinoembryonic antigen-related cell adhesion molecule 7-like [Anneissia japonica]
MYLASLIIWVLNFVPGILPQSRILRVNPATAKLGEDALITYTFTPEPGDDFDYLVWFESDADGVIQGVAGNIINNIPGNPPPNPRYNLSDNGSLIIYNVEVEDTGYYLLRVILAISDQEPWVDVFSTLTVFYIETPLLEPQEKTVNENESAIFLCPLPDGVPTPITITWIKDGGALNVSDTEKYPQLDTTLEIIRVNEMDEGDYQCRAENEAYSGDEGKLSNTGTLSVFHQPKPTTHHSQKIEPGSDTDLLVGITFLGIVIGIVLSSSVFVFLWWKTRTSSSNKYTTYNTKQKTDIQTYEDLRRNEDTPSVYEDLSTEGYTPSVYMNVKTKR